VSNGLVNHVGYMIPRRAMHNRATEKNKTTSELKMSSLKPRSRVPSLALGLERKFRVVK
jgi:hypothetical protein